MTNPEYLRQWQYLFIIHLISRLLAALIWIYQGLVPKILFSHADEIRLLVSGGLTESESLELLPLIGWGEIGFGIFLLLSLKLAWPLALSALGMIFATVGVVMTSPIFLIAAFNPATLNVALFGLSVIGFLSLIALKKDDAFTNMRS